MSSHRPHTLSKKVLNELLKIIPTGSTILEIGTGYGTEKLVDYYKVLSIESDIKWYKGFSELIYVPTIPVKEINLPDAFYRRFPSASQWYDPVLLQENLSNKTYSAIIVDGPSGTHSRAAMWWFYDKLFNINVPVIVDDVHRRCDWTVAMNIGKCKGVKSFKVVYGGNDDNMFAVLV